MAKPVFFKSLFLLTASVCLAPIPAPAFAQHGGGGGFRGGGGFHGGGGFRGGGGAGFRGGGFSGGVRGMPALRGGGAFVRPGAPGGYRPYSNPRIRTMRPGFWNGTGRATVPGRELRPPNADGRSSSVVPRGAGRASVAPPPGIGSRSGSSGGPWRSFGANRAAAMETPPARIATAPNALQARNSVSQVLGLSAIHRAFGNSGFGNLRLRSNAFTSRGPRPGNPLLARPRTTVLGPGTAPRNSFRSDFSRNHFGFRDFGRFRFRPRFPRFPFRDFDDFFFDFDFDDFFVGRPFNCFACGFGFGGFSFGFGAPLWWGSAWPVWSGGIGYPSALPYGYSLPYDYSLAYNSPAYTRSQSDNFSASGTSQGAQNSSAALALYLKDGTMYSVRDSWLVDGKLHYIATDGSEGVVELSALDIQRTVDENAARGVPFTLKPNPAGSRPVR